MTLICGLLVSIYSVQVMLSASRMEKIESRGDMVLIQSKDIEYMKVKIDKIETMLENSSIVYGSLDSNEKLISRN